MYIKAVELSIANNVTKTKEKPSGTYRIDDNGKSIIKIVDGKEKGKPIEVNYKGTGLEEGTIEVKEGKVTKLRGTKITGKYAAKVYDRIEFFDELPEATLVTGQDFNGKIKTLVSEEEKVHTDTDEIVKSIEFLSYGRLPEGYTKEDLLKLEQVDVSNKQDKSILALHNGNGNVFIYSEGLIFLNSSSYMMFSNFRTMTKLIFGLVDTSNTTKMGRLFNGCISLIELDIKYFDTSNVTQMYQMFAACNSIENLDLSHFDTTKVTNMQEMFDSCTNLKEIDLSNFDTSKVTHMGAMFEECRNIENINISNFDTSNVLHMNRMFCKCPKLKTLDLTSFDTTEVIGMTSMFYNSTNLTLIEVSDKWITGENTDVTTMFYGCGTNTVTLK